MNATENQVKFAADIASKKNLRADLVAAFSPVAIIEARNCLRSEGSESPQYDQHVNQNLAALVLASLGKKFVSTGRVMALSAYYGGYADSDAALAACRLSPEQVEVVDSFAHLAQAVGG